MRVLYFTLVLFLFSNSSEAQFGKMQKNKAKSALEKKVKTTDGSSSNTSNDSNSNKGGIAESSSSSKAEYSDEEFKKELEKNKQ